MKICLCGSTRFKNEWLEANVALTLDGHVVYSVAVMTHFDDVAIAESNKEILDLVHKRKILESDAVVIVSDDTGYYGDSTKSELQWAAILGIPIYEHYSNVTAVPWLPEGEK